MRGGTRSLVLAACLLAAFAAVAAPASAEIPASLLASCTPQNAAPGFDYRFCDDGVPSFGGTNPNPTGALAVTVPAKYRGYIGLPGKAPGASSVPGADAQGNVALDVDISYPRKAKRRLPLMFMMHGCCGGNKTGWEVEDEPAGKRFDAGGQQWHYSNAWFAARGYVVVTYTARGFRTNDGKGSTGQTQLDARSNEINDYQHLACQLTALFNRSRELPNIAPRRVVATGGSYGGGFSWMAATDPKWTCNKSTGAARTKMRLAAAAPKFGWTDLNYSLLPSGTHDQRPGHLPLFNGCSDGPYTLGGGACPGSANPIAIPKRSISTGLYLQGAGLVGNNRTTFAPEIDQAFTCLTGAYPPELNPACEDAFRRILPVFLRERSAYYQNRWFSKIRRDPSYRVAIFDAATFTDQLFTAVENRRMINRIRDVVPGYPLQAYYGDYSHFTNDKPALWGDVCGSDRHVCTQSDFSRGFNQSPPSLVRTGVTTRLNRFIDHFASPARNRNAPAPQLDVTAELQICPQTAASFGLSASQGGPQFSAANFERLAPGKLNVAFRDSQTTTSTASPNPHATGADPVFSNGGKCHQESGPAGVGTASYDSAELNKSVTMIGATRVTVDFTAAGDTSSMQLDARLYDVFANGTAVLVDRGPRRLTSAEAARGEVSYQLQGNGWRFLEGHRIRIELTQDDDPYLHASEAPSSATISRVRLAIPTRGKGKQRLLGH